MSTVPSPMWLAARPDEIARIHRCWNAPLPITRVTICAKVLLVKMMDTIQGCRSGSPARVNGACYPRGRPTAPSRYLQSSLYPRVLACIVHTHARSPAESTMSSHVFRSLTAISPSVLRVCVVPDKNRIHVQGTCSHIPEKALKANMP